MKYCDIFTLRHMLTEARVPHEFFKRSHDGLELYQIYYPNADAWVCSILQGDEIPGEGVELFWRPRCDGRWLAWNIIERIERRTAEDAFKHIYLSYVKWRWHEGKS